MSPLPLDVNSGAHDEDLDTSGAAGALAAALAAGQLGFKLSGTDTLKIPRPVDYLGFIYMDETATPDADGKVVIGNKRAYEIPFDAMDPNGLTQFWAGKPIRMASDETIDVTARSSGAGAEHHICAHYVSDPGLGEPWKTGNLEGEISLAVQQVTGTLVAHTISGFTDICGRDVAYAGSQNKIPKSSDIKLKVYAITPLLGAGYSAVALRDPKGVRQLLFPGASPTTDQAKRYDLVKMFGAPLECDAQNPFELGGIGVSTTAQSALIEMVLSGVGIDG